MIQLFNYSIEFNYFGIHFDKSHNQKNLDHTLILNQSFNHFSIHQYICFHFASFMYHFLI